MHFHGVTAEDVAAIIAALAEQLAPSTVRTVYAVFRKLMQEGRPMCARR